MTIVSGEGTAPAIEQCLQFNWQYDGIPGLPHGNPAITDCINTICAYAPDTHLPTFGATTPGTINLPVTVTGFSLISGFNLTFEYDSTTMSYAGNTPNSIFTPQNGLLTVSVIPGTDGKKKVLMSYDGVAITLGDNSQLVNFQFNYISGGTSLTWLTSTNECMYFDAYGHRAYDLPNSDYYFNGEVISLSAPFSKIDSVTSFSGDYVTFPVRVWDFRNVLSGHLTLNYPAGNLTYVDAVQDPALPLNFQDNVTTPGTLVLTWSGTGLTLPDGYAITYLTFLYSGGSSNLTWYNNGSSCQYVNSVLLVPFTDVPTQNFYQNGNVSSANFYWSGQTSQDWNNPGNWSGNIVPYQPVNVIIDNSLNPQHWPLFSGNLGIGNECNNIMLTGPGQLSVSGDLIIEPGHDLVISGPGHILTGGSWINSGNFQPGTGTIEFTGNGIVEIPNGVPPAQYIESYQVAEFPKNMTLISDLSEGPFGDNAHADVSIGFNFKYLGIDYTQVRINTNGWISFNLSGEDLTSGNNINLFTQDLPATALAPWWDDLKANAVNNINYVTEGIAPNRVFTVEWKNVYSYRINATTRLFFQVKLYETTNIIEFCYGNNVAGTVNTAEGASIGIKDSTGGQGHFIEATQNSSYNILPVLKCTTNWPTVNYRFTPATQSSNEIFNRLINSKTGGELRILKDVTITGTE